MGRGVGIVELVRLKLFIISCIFVSILDFAELVHIILVSDHALLNFLPPPLTITLVLA